LERVIWSSSEEERYRMRIDAGKLRETAYKTGAKSSLFRVISLLLRAAVSSLTMKEACDLRTATAADAIIFLLSVISREGLSSRVSIFLLQFKHVHQTGSNITSTQTFRCARVCIIALKVMPAMYSHDLDSNMTTELFSDLQSHLTHGGLPRWIYR
jgi:hypothetical protein